MSTAMVSLLLQRGILVHGRALQELYRAHQLAPVHRADARLDEREKLLVGIAANVAGRPLRPGINQRVAQRELKRLAGEAAASLYTEARRTSDIQRADELRGIARQLETATPHMLRHSLARRLLASGAALPEVQRILGHSRLETTVRYLIPSEEDLRVAIGKAGI